MELHKCPDCNKYWVYCNSCGYLSEEAYTVYTDRGFKGLIKCKRCECPYWVYEDTPEETCPPCEKWNSKEYKEWTVEE